MAKQKDQNPSKIGNGLLWAIFVLLLLVAAYGNYRFEQVSMAIRLAVGIVGLIILLFIASLTSQGRRFVGFTKDTRMELRKVVWPHRQETVQTTLMVIVMIIITAIILWGIDSFLMWAISWLTGQRG